MKNIKLISIKELKPHEKINKKNLEKIKNIIKSTANLKNPIIVDKHNLVILDGHHRTRALLDLGYKKIAVQLVDYYDSKIKVLGRRKNIKVTKGKIIDRALLGKLFPEKTSKHLVPQRVKGLGIDLGKLK